MFIDKVLVMSFYLSFIFVKVLVMMRGISRLIMFIYLYWGIIERIGRE